ncbi:NAD(P)/FAD-dependent oxidoreductase [Nocardioides sp. NPDC127503]|uniref:flavin-containing monooxygenase n=1 Tax=Nocardioides sp. NPDC127503 TaxID=3154516 RepID=UPI00332754EB
MHVDVLIIGAGVSGIGAAAQLRERLPGKTLAILEQRDASGGTWDLFRYPGIRSDSDMFTFAFKWRPWESAQALADGHQIRDYLRRTAKDYGVDKLIHYGHKVTGAAWSTEDKQWTVSVETSDGPTEITAGFLWNCSGYYDYANGYQPEFAGLDDYEGTFVHPQHWPEDLDYAGKKVVIIGSGATAVTLLPNLAGEGSDRAEKVTMLQRTPTYILSRPGQDAIASLLNTAPFKLLSKLPFKRVREKLGHETVRWENIALTVGTYQLARRAPGVVKKVIRDQWINGLTARGGRPGMTKDEAIAYVDKHFNPPYNPWDQRICFVPDGDMMKSIREGYAAVVTDRIKTFVPKGIELESGETLEADIVISATGLNLRLFGGLDYTVDGEQVSLPEQMAYKGLMITGIPNFAYTIGYTNASWTLKADLVTDYVIRLLDFMGENGYDVATVTRDPSVEERPFMDLASGYIQRSLDLMPKAGDRSPWTAKQNYLVDMKALGSPVADGVIRFA